MSDTMEDDTDISESEMEEYADSCLDKLKQGEHTVKVSEDEYNCPYCPGKEKQIFGFKELLQHASGVSQGSRKRKVRDRGNHLGIVKYMQEDLNGENHFTEFWTDTYELHEGSNANDRLVWPWMGIVANIPVKWENGRCVGSSGSKFRDELTRKGFHPVRVHPLWNHKGHTGYAVVEFRNELLGLSDAIRFDNAYEAIHQGKKDYFEAGDKIYCWVARDDDYYSKNVVGDYLKKNGDLKTIAQYQEEERRKNSKLISNLTSTIEDQDILIKEIETKYKETTISLSNLISEKDEMLLAFNEERQKMQLNARGQLEGIFKEHERVAMELEEQRNELDQCEKELQEREAYNEKERAKLRFEKLRNERAILEQKKADEKVLHLAEDHKREKEELNRKIIQLEKKLDSKQALELDILHLERNMQLVRRMGDVEDAEVAAKLHSIEKDLAEKAEELEDLEALNQALIIKERRSNDELQEARKELINGLSGQSSRAIIGIKRMGELDNKAFSLAAKSKYLEDEADLKAAELCSLWDSHIRNPNWHPFKTVLAEDGNTYKTIIDEEDKKLKELRKEYGEEVYQAVATALLEMNDYNPSGSYAISELWNYKEQRRATIKEGVSHLIKQWRLLKRKKN